MAKFKVKPAPVENRSNMLIQLDNDLQHWVRTVAAENKVTITEVVNQVFAYAKQNA